MTVATDALVLIRDLLNGISKHLTLPTGCPFFPGFELDHVAQKQFLPQVAQAALAESVETGGTLQHVKFCTGTNR